MDFLKVKHVDNVPSPVDSKSTEVDAANVNPSEPGRTVCRDTFPFGCSVCPHHACELAIPACIDSVVLSLLPVQMPVT
jgi:hypothetical protein